MPRCPHTGSRAATTAGRSALLGLLIVVALLVVLAILPASCGEDTTSNDLEEALRDSQLDLHNELLKRELDLASGPDFYFMLDPTGAKLNMMLAGVALHEYEVLDIGVSTPRLFFARRRAPSDWADRIWSGGRLYPARDRDRMEIVAGDDDAGQESSEPAIPPTAEEAVTVPAPYWIRFDGGFALEVRARAADGKEVVNRGPFMWLRNAARELAGSVGLPMRDRVRLVVLLKEEDAAALYRSAPPNVSFLAVSR